jgi:lysozyme family protein
MTQLRSFDDCFAAVIGVEQGYSDNPADPGGETMYGITERVARANYYSGAMKDLELATAKAIAKAQYWDKFQCGQLPIALAYLVFDAAYNGGHPVQWLQEAVGASPDGVIGAQTIGAVRSANPLAVAMQFCASHLEYYASCKEPVFADGWMNRVAGSLRLVVETLGAS